MYTVRRLVLVSALLIASQALKAQILLTADLSGANEVPPVSTTATGTAWAILSADMTTLTYQVTYARLQGTFSASHFHMGFQGIAGPVIRTIIFSGNTAVGTWTGLPDSVVSGLLRGKIYINIHSSSSPGGEIRAQLTVRSPGFTVSLDGSQEVPPASTTANGTGWVAWEPDSLGTPRVIYRVTIAGLAGAFTASHFHAAPPGVAGPVVRAISFGGDSTANGEWAGLADSNVTHLVKGNLYVNVHSGAFPGGEIRGQVTRVAPSFFTVGLDGSQENPPVSTTSIGTGWAVLNVEMTNLKYQFTYAGLQGNFSASHFHVAPRGSNGGVVRAISFSGNTAAGEWTALPDSMVRHLLKGSVYANVHSSTDPGGEIRGQFDLLGNVTGFSANLDGAQEVPPVSTTATGTGYAIDVHYPGTEEDSVLFRVTIAGLSGTFSAAHIHSGPPGVAGGIVHAITFSDSTAEGTWGGFSDANLVDLAKGNLYFNVHSSAAPGGEIRGQILLGSGPVTSVEQLSSDIPAGFRLGQNYPNPFNPRTSFAFDLPSRSRVSLKIYNLLGQEILTLIDEVKDAGSYSAQFDAQSLSSGVYFYRMSADRFSQTQKMILLK